MQCAGKESGLLQAILPTLTDAVLPVGSVSKVEVSCDCCHTGPCVDSVPTQGVAHADIYRRPLPSLPKRPNRQTWQNCPRNPGYLCQNQTCTTGSFLLDYLNRGCLPEVKESIIDMSLNASGVRDTARSLHISTNTVLSELKKKEPSLESVVVFQKWKMFHKC